ncbi:hypothetical protein [Limnobaculum parvum]|nr:hypothetical protein [Limnobaculum parvum]
MTSSLITDVPVAARPQTCNMYAFRHYIARQNRFIDPAVLGQLMILKIEAQSRLNQYTDVAIDLEPEVNRLRRWTQIVLCELPSGFNSIEGTRASGIIAPELIIKVLIKENIIRHHPRRLAYTQGSAITRTKSPLEHYPQVPPFVELFNDECHRLGLSELQHTVSQLSSTLMEASERERFALVCFHALLSGDIDTVLRQSVVTLNALMLSYLTQHPELQVLVEEYLFFAFYSSWPDNPISI